MAKSLVTSAASPIGNLLFPAVVGTVAMKFGDQICEFFKTATLKIIGSVMVIDKKNLKFYMLLKRKLNQLLIKIN